MTTTETTFKPILFSTEMVQAILEGRKGQTRRKFKDEVFPNESELIYVTDTNDGRKLYHFGIKGKQPCPHQGVIGEYTKGDVLWVRETFREVNHYGFDYEFYEYKAGGTSAHCFIPDMDQLLHDDKWKPSIHMPKEAARIFLEVTDVRIEKLQNISEKDAIAEGVRRVNKGDKGISVEGEFIHSENSYYFYPCNDLRDNSYMGEQMFGNPAHLSFMSLWAQINGWNSWNKNPWVWVIEFKQIEKPQNFI